MKMRRFCISEPQGGCFETLQDASELVMGGGGGLGIKEQMVSLLASC
jgi:hypothetical protein